MTAHAESNWLPVRFSFTPRSVSVRWLDFGRTTLSQPFFNQTLRQLRRTEPPASERMTDLSELLRSRAAFDAVRPAGIIFHVSRCGSTFLANGLKAAENVIVLSEAAVFGVFFLPQVFRASPYPKEGWDDARRTLLECVISLYAHRFGAGTQRVVLKCHAASLLQIRLVRSVWPDVPMVVLIRDPVEVMVSNLARPSAWLRSKNSPARARGAFGWSETEIEAMSREEFCARGIGRFCLSAAEAKDTNRDVIDYRELDIDKVYEVAQKFGIELPPRDSAAIRRVKSAYAKDLTGERTYADDSGRKQKEASELIRHEAARWARPYYEALLETR
jgi:hypothetical protein